MSLSADKIYTTVLAAGEQWADARSAYELLDDMRQTILADVTSGLYGTCGSKSEADTMARCSSVYRDHLAALGRARKVWLHAEVRYKTAQLLAELRRSEESTRRAEIQLR